MVGTNGVAKHTAPPNGTTRWGSSGGTPSNDWEANGVNGGLPIFADESIYDFRLATNSPMLDAGTTISGFSTDAYGNPRPQGSAWDIGPLEFVPTQEAAPESQTRIIRATTFRVGNFIMSN